MSGPLLRRRPRTVRASVRALRRSVALTMLNFSAVLAAVLAAAPSVLLPLDRQILRESASALLLTTLLAGATAAFVDWLETKRLSFLLRALSSADHGMVDHNDVLSLNRLARRASLTWLLSQLVALSLLAAPLRPSLIDLPTGVSLMLLGWSITAVAALALYATLRRAALRALELVPARVMSEVVLRNEQRSETQNRIGRRLLIAVIMPMTFVALGSALIANAHVRRADERSREALARVMASAIFEPSPEAVGDIGLQDLYARATELEFPTRLLEDQRPASVRRLSGGRLEVTTPLSTASALTQFGGSTVPVLSFASLMLLGVAVCVAAALALALGNALIRDLHEATGQVRRLGTRAPLDAPEEADVPRARFIIVDELQRAIEQVATRFRVFALSQQDAIEARSAATRMRGQFFASVSHDLRGPLNSILGFTELVRSEPLSEGQAESLQVVADRGHELLTLIETILDAARVEAGQLSLMFDQVEFAGLYRDALDKAQRLSSGTPLRLYEDIQPDLPSVLVDRMRSGRAIAAFIAYSVRATGGRKMWIRAEREGDDYVRIDVDVPATRQTADELQLLLEPSGGLSKREHRGLTLALQLAHSVIRLHGGYVRVVDRGAKGAMFCITLPVSLDARQPASPPS